MPRVYNPDHTAWIRRRIRRMALLGLIGLVVAACAITVTVTVGGTEPAFLPILLWAATGVLTGVSLADLIAAAVLWRVYQRRRPYLDAQAAEIEGERLARLALMEHRRERM